MQLRKVIFELDLKILNGNSPDHEEKSTHTRERDLHVQGHRVMEEKSIWCIQRIAGTFMLMK